LAQKNSQKNRLLKEQQPQQPMNNKDESEVLNEN